MEGVSRVTALTIQNRDVRCEAGGPTEEGKYVGWVMLDVERWRPLLTTEPIYSSYDEAEEAMKGMVKTIRETDLAV